MNTIYLLSGSNLGNRRLHLTYAAENISKEVGTVLQQSSVYETQAWGNTAVPDYLNQVLKVQTGLEPLAVLRKILLIEAQQGRRREEKWGSRTLDIDLLFYENRIINTPELTVPHPLLHMRRFTLEPLAEIAPGLVHPVLEKNILQLKTELVDALIVKKL